MNIKEPETYSVSQLSELLKGVFSNPFFSSLIVYGEVYSIKRGKFTYIDLGDQGHNEINSPILKCAFSTFYGSNLDLENIKVGDIIQIKGTLSYYSHGSSLTFWGKEVSLLQSQLGKTLLEKKRILEKLDKLGYLDPKRKKAIPKFCKKVAILTAKNGAAYQDILKTLKDRFPCHTTLYPTIVQGEGAVSSIVKQLTRASQGDFDVIILGRGGGSKTDLSCFDDEKVALAIATCPIPIITCIGHTIDTAIADRVSDAQAITPTEGASLINESLVDVYQYFKDIKSELSDKIYAVIRPHILSLEHLKKHLDSLSPVFKLHQEMKEIERQKKLLKDLYEKVMIDSTTEVNRLYFNLKSMYQNLLEIQQKEIMNKKELLESYNPETYAKKGFALILKNGKRVTSSLNLEADDTIEITYLDGRKEAKIL